MMPRLVSVYDNYIPEHVTERLFEFSRAIKWSFGWRSRSIGDRFSYWHSHFCGGRIEERSSCLDELYGSEDLLPLMELWEFAKNNIEIIDGYRPARIYGNAHTFGNEGYLHRDSAKEDEALTMLFYAHPIWAANWGGETAFFNDTYDTVLESIYPKPGRLIVFPGEIPHVARSPGREATELRVTFMYKLYKE